MTAATFHYFVYILHLYTFLLYLRYCGWHVGVADLLVYIEWGLYQPSPMAAQ